MHRRLIVNTDGFGFSDGSNRGILECLPAGVIRSVSVNANFRAVDDLGRLVTEFPHVSVGIHFNLTVGPCVANSREIPALVDDRGEFLGPAFGRRVLAGRIPHQQMVRELTAQAERLAGHRVRATHWDGHQNQHLYPPFFRAAIEVAQRFGIERMRSNAHYLFTVRGARRLRVASHLATHPTRAARYALARWLMRRAQGRGLRMADRLITPAVLDGTHKRQRQFWLELFRRLPEGTSEVYCHPGYADDTLFRYATYVREREDELDVLRDPSLADEARRRGVELVNFSVI